MNVGQIPSDKIVRFREKRRDEIANLRKCVFNLHAELGELEEDSIREDRIRRKINELSQAMIEYQKSADLIKAKGWFGVSLMGVPAPIGLGKILELPTASTIIIAATGIALGGIYSINKTKNELDDLKKDSPVSCLIEMRKSFKEYTNARGGGDMNYHAFNCMEEYVND